MLVKDINGLPHRKYNLYETMMMYKDKPHLQKLDLSLQNRLNNLVFEYSEHFQSGTLNNLVFLLL